MVFSGVGYLLIVSIDSQNRGNFMKLTLALATAALLATTSFANALDRRVQIYNDTDFTIVQFYASNKGTNDWQEDILGNEVLVAGSSVMVNIDDGTGYCKFDFLAVFEDEDQVVSSDNNICELSEFHFTP